MRADDLVVVGAFAPRAEPDKVLRFEERVAEEVGGGGHGDEFGTGHGLPELVEEGAVVDLWMERVRKWNGMDLLDGGGKGTLTYSEGGCDAFF